MTSSVQWLGRSDATPTTRSMKTAPIDAGPGVCPVTPRSPSAGLASAVTGARRASDERDSPHHQFAVTASHQVRQHAVPTDAAHHLGGGGGTGQPQMLQEVLPI